MTKEQYISYEKLSKRKQKELNALRRGTWGALSPVTRKPPKPGSYHRGKEKKACRDEIRHDF